MTKLITIKEIETAIASIKAAEMVTRKQLGGLSRHLLEFLIVQNTDRVEFVNTLLMVLTPINKRTAILFFRHHLPWGFDESVSKFGKKFDDGKRMDKKVAASLELLAEPNGNIWTWAMEHTKTEAKTPDYTKRLVDATKAALKGKGEGHEGKITALEVIQAVMLGGIPAKTIIDMIGDLNQVNEARAEQAANDTTPASKIA